MSMSSRSSNPFSVVYPDLKTTFESMAHAQEMVCNHHHPPLAMIWGIFLVFNIFDGWLESEFLLNFTDYGRPERAVRC